MKVKFTMPVLCLLLNVAHAQQLRELKIGDTLPPVKINYLQGNIIKNTFLKTFYTDNFLIIDFWANWCSPCIKGISEADSVLKTFNGNIKILPVTYQDSNTIRTFLAGNDKLKNLKLNYAVGDTALMGGYFKFKILPHDVWIDTQGIVKAITYPDEVTSTNISRFIHNESLSIEEKTDIIDFDMEKALNVENNNFLYRAVLTKYKQGLSNMIGTLSPAVEKDFKENKFIVINKDILSMFYAAYSQSNGTINFNRIELHVEDSLSLCPFLIGNDVSRQQIMKHSYCYEFNLPEKASKDSFYSYIMANLNILFPFKATIEKRKKICWIFVNKDSSKNPVSLETEPSSTKWEGGFVKKIINKSTSELVSYLNWNMELQVVDESHFTRLLTMNFDLKAKAKNGSSYLEPDGVKASIIKYGFDIVKGERSVDVLVIRQKR